MEEVGAGVVAPDGGPAIGVDDRTDHLADLGQPLGGIDPVLVEATEGQRGVQHPRGTSRMDEDARVADLATGLRVERRAVQDHDITEGEQDRRLHLVHLASDEVGHPVGLEHSPQVAGHGAGGDVPAGRPGPLLLVGHGRLEALQVHLHIPLGRDLLGQLQREAVGVVQLERNVAGQPPVLAELPEGIVEDGQADAEGLPEATLLTVQHVAYEGMVAFQLRIVRTHDLHDGIHQQGHDLVLDAEQPGMADGAPDYPPQHVAPVLVAGERSVADQEGGRPGVVGQDPLRYVGAIARTVGNAADLADPFQQA